MAKAGLLFVGTDDGLVLFSDPGASGRWLRIGHELRGEVIVAVWPLFDDPQVVLAGGSAGLWRSEDGGASWQRHADSAVQRFAGDKATPQVVILRTESGTIQQSTDAGLTWERLAGEAMSSGADRVTLGGKTPVLLAVRDQAIIRSDNDGATWAATSVDEAWSGTITVIAAARYHIDTAYAGSTGGQLAVTTDRGQTWHVLKRDLPPVRDIVATRLA